MLGHTTQDINAADLILDFFLAPSAVEEREVRQRAFFGYFVTTCLLNAWGKSFGPRGGRAAAH